LTKINRINWMAENLNVSHFRNGDLINEAKNKKAWEKANNSFKPCYCYYDYDAKNIEYGKFYNVYAIYDNRGIAPQGWRLPLDKDFRDLISAANSLNINLLAESEKTVLNAAGDDILDFSVLLSGVVNQYGSFEYFESASQFCSSQEIPNVGIKVMHISSFFQEIQIWNVPRNELGCNIRCVKD